MDKKSEYKILVVDDNPEQLDIVIRALSKSNNKLLTAENGAQCMDILQREKPDIILLDVMLPDANGIDLARTIKKDPAFSSVVVILISSMFVDSKNITKGLEVGADAYIARPIKNLELAARVQAACRVIQSKRELHENIETNWKSTFDSIDDLIIQFDSKGIITQANKSATELLQKSEKELVGFKCSAFFNGSYCQTEDCPVKRMMKSFKKESLFMSIGEKWYEEIVDPLTDKEGNFSGGILILKDATEHELRKMELELAMEKAKESDRLKSAFLLNLSHEIRTPMNGILGFSELLAEPGLRDDQRRNYISIIEKSGRRMLQTINEIVEMSMIETGLIEITISYVNINDLLLEIYTLFKSETFNKNLNFKIIDMLPPEACHIQTDRAKIIAILSHLVRNAIKYTHKGSIEFGCIIQMAGQMKELKFFVKDTGIGIPSDRHMAIFGHFVQADIEDKNAYQGAGLGLTISKSFVEMLKGKMWLESIEGEGTTFYFSLPF